MRPRAFSPPSARFSGRRNVTRRATLLYVEPGRPEAPRFVVWLAASDYAVVQVKPELGTGPLAVGELNVQFTVSTSSPASNVSFAFESWNTVIVADVNARSVMASVHCRFGQSGAPAIGVIGGFVTVVIVTLPFLMSLTGTVVDPDTWACAGFWPGGWVAPAGFVHVAVGFAVGVSSASNTGASSTQPQGRSSTTC
jgi:hypothetical protein